MMKVSKRETILLVILFIMICGFLYYNFYFVNAMAEIDSLNAEVDTLNTQVRDAKQKAVAVDLLKKQVTDIQNEASVKLSKVISSIDQPDLLMMISNQLNGLSQESSISFAIDYQKLPSSRVTSVKVQFLTNYQSLKQILLRLNQAPYVNRVVIGTVETSSSMAGKTTGDNNLQASLSVEFFTRDNEPSGKDYPFMTGPYPNANLFPS